MKHFYKAIPAACLMAMSIFYVGAANAAGFPATSTDIVTSAKGTSAAYVLSGTAYYPDLDNNVVMAIEYDGKNTHVVTDEANNKLYIFNPFSKMPTSSYLVGDLNTDAEGNKTAVFSLPQCVYQSVPGDPSSFKYAAIMKPGMVAGEASYSPTDAQVLTLNWQDGAWVYNYGEDPLALLGLCDSEGYWEVYCEKNNKLTPFTDKVVTAPAGLQTSRWDLVYRGKTGHHVTVGFDNDDVYIQGISQMFPGAWIKGTIKDDKIEFEPFQYVGMTATGYHAWLCGGTPTDDPEHFEFDRNLVMDYNADDAQFNYSGWLLIESSKTMSLTVERYKEPVFTDSSILSGDLTPVAPEITYFLNPPGVYSMKYINVDIPTVSKSGRLLESDRIYYRVFLDDELLVFEENAIGYVNFQTPISELPWNFADEWDVKSDLERFEIHIYQQGVEKVEVESEYRTPEGDVLVSRSAPYYSSGVKLPEATPKAEIFTNLQGQQVMNPAGGVFIQTNIYSDGTRRSFKVIKK